MRTPSDPTPQEPGPHPVTAADTLRCAGCGYDLRGLADTAACPECGRPVAYSAGGDLVCFQRPDWLSRLAESTVWQVAANLLALTYNAWWLLPLDESGAAALFAGPAPTLLWLIGAVVDVVAVWYFTTPEPDRSEGLMPPSLRATARWLAVGVHAAALITFVAFPDPAQSRVAVTNHFLVMTAGMADMVLWFLYAHRLALRLPDLSLALQLMVVMVGMLVTSGAWAWYPQLDLFARTYGAELPPLDARAAWFGWVAFIGYDVYLLLRFRAALRAARGPATDI